MSVAKPGEFLEGFKFQVLPVHRAGHVKDYVFLPFGSGVEMPLITSKHESSDDSNREWRHPRHRGCKPHDSEVSIAFAFEAPVCVCVCTMDGYFVGILGFIKAAIVLNKLQSAVSQKTQHFIWIFEISIK